VADELAIRRRGVVHEARVPERDGGAPLLLVEILADGAGLPQEDVVADVGGIDRGAVRVRDDQHRRALDEFARLDRPFRDDPAPTRSEIDHP
jgi:hypothetical protein